MPTSSRRSTPWPGPSPRAVLALQALCGVAAVVLVMVLAAQLFRAAPSAVESDGDRAAAGARGAGERGPDRAVVLLAGLLAACYGPAIAHELVLLRTALVSLLGLAAVVLAIRALRAPERAGRALLAGALGGLGFLLRSDALLFVAGALLVAGWTLRADPRRRRFMLAYAAGVAIALLPLVARNLAVGAPPASLASGGTISFVNHNAEDYELGGGTFLSRHAARIMERSGGRLLPAALATLRTHAGPGSLARMVGRKAAAFWHWYEIPNNANYYYFLLFVPLLAWLGVGMGLIAPLGVVGLGLAALRRDGRSPALALAACYLASGWLTAVLFFNLSRLRTPYVLALVPFAALAAVELGRALRARRSSRAVAIAAAAAVVAIPVLWPLEPGREPVTIADYGVGNELALQLARQQSAAGDRTGALARLERQLGTAPADLKALDPQRGEAELTPLGGAVAGSFAPLHQAAAEVHEQLGQPAAAAEQRARGVVLELVARRFSGGPPAD